ncbi:MuF-like minor capsid protein [Corynebacterium phage EmiRose]|uniref:MuF-like minor capsid protein n=1 Tax=Corynebacterium phage EmiRose TaxID=2565372 RepID=A0A649VNV7_9CAUD|nr:MuF-like minor capsid protein [Corynebacterium phage EmiRose]QGJ94137.1 MuF-like minor capsid protein [Corynebacterium phage EmiRose]
MAHTQKGKDLTEEHRRAQLSITASVVDILKELFLSLFDLDDIDGSCAKFVKRALPVVLKARAFSTDTAEEYLRTFRSVELSSLVDARHLPTDVLKVPRDMLKRYADDALLYTDDVKDYLDILPDAAVVARDMLTSSAAVAKASVKAGKSEDEIKARALQTTQAKGIRLVSDGGRAPLIAEVKDGAHGAVGYARVVDPDPCPFCAMLASRGAVYSTDSFTESNALFSGDGAFKVHDGCECTMEPIYGRRVKNLPPSSQELSKQWAEIAAGQPDPWAAWRRYRTSGTLPGNEAVNAVLGVDGNARASAPQYGRAKRKAQRGGRGRKEIQELSIDDLQSTAAGLRIRRSKLESELASLESRGISVDEPGPAKAIATQLDRIDKQLAYADKKLKQV